MKNVNKFLEIIENNVVGSWIEKDERKEISLSRFENLNSLMQPMYNLILSYSNYYSIPKDYGTGIELTMIEVHILQDLLNPELNTVSKLATKWKRTKSAISQTMRKLEEKGLIEKNQNEKNKKILNLHLTELGYKTVDMHTRFDNLDITKTVKELIKEHSEEEMATFFNICESYNKILEEYLTKIRK